MRQYGILAQEEFLVFSDLPLARRLEAAEAANARGCTAIHPEAASLDVAGGCAVFVGAGSPLSHAVGIGLNGPVTEPEIDRLEAFFRSRGGKVSIELCPLADPGLLPMLGDRGYRVTEFNNVLVKRLAGTGIVLTPRVRRALPDEIRHLEPHRRPRLLRRARTDDGRDGRGPRHLCHARSAVLSGGDRERRTGRAAPPRRSTTGSPRSLRTARSPVTGAADCTAN